MSDKRMDLWICTAVVTLLAHFSGGAWTTLFVLVVAGYVLGKNMPMETELLRGKRWFCVVQLIGLYLLLGQLIPMSAEYWPGEKAELIVPGVLLVLGLYASGKKPHRVAAVLFWAVLILFVPLVLAGIKDMRVERIVPEGMEISIWTIPAVLLPFVVKLATGKKEIGKSILNAGMIGVEVWMLVTGMLSFSVAKTERTPLRLMTQTLTIGPNSRFESIASAAITLGWYCFISLVLLCINEFWKGLGVNEKKRNWLSAFVLFVMLLTGVTIEPIFTVAYLILAWTILPVLISKKAEKSA